MEKNKILILAGILGYQYSNYVNIPLIQESIIRRSLGTFTQKTRHWLAAAIASYWKNEMPTSLEEFSLPEKRYLLLCFAVLKYLCDLPINMRPTMTGILGLQLDRYDDDHWLLSTCYKIPETDLCRISMAVKLLITYK